MNDANLDNIIKENIVLKDKLGKLKELEREIDLFREKDRVLSIAKVGAWIYDIKTNVFKASDEFLGIIGMLGNRKELTLEEFLGALKLKDTTHFMKVLRDPENCYETFPFDEITKINRDEETILNFNGDYLREPEGDCEKIVGSIQDVTKLRANQVGLENSNRKLKKFISLIDEYVLTFEVDLGFNVTAVSEAFRKAVEKDCDTCLIGKSFFNFLEDEERSLEKSIVSFLEKDQVWSGEFNLKSIEEKDFLVKANIAPNYGIDLKKTGYTVIGEDITSLKRLEEMSTTDELTGLYNRRFFNQVIKSEMSRNRRSGEDMTFIMIDVGYFKQYNDTYGHQSGDKVLEKVADIFLKNLHRGEDYAFRLGGEEFGILFSGVSKEHSTFFAEKIREEIEQLKIPHPKNPASDYITVSMGIIVIKLKYEVADEHSIYTTADTALYRAKELGRNRCQVHESGDLELF